jgi:hypothetical protein
MREKNEPPHIFVGIFMDLMRVACFLRADFAAYITLNNDPRGITMNLANERHN